MSTLRWGKAVIWAVVAFPVSFIVFNVLYVKWAEWAYPHTNSMAGFAAFIYGFPVGLGASIATFLIVLGMTNRRPQAR
jgi:hypothetical protein